MSVLLTILGIICAVVGLGGALLGEGLKGIALIVFAIFLIQLGHSGGR